ncbi:hypothetical protein RQP46_007655 [Phenoliferia psychrophenolica]
MYPERFPPDSAPLVLPNLRHLEVYVDGGENDDGGDDEDDEDEWLSLATIEAIFTPFRQSLLSLRLVDLQSDTIAKRLVKVLAGAEPFSHVRHLAFQVPGYDAFRVVCDIISAFPSLVTLELELFVGIYTPGQQVAVVAELGDTAPSTLQNLIFNSAGMDEDVIMEILDTIKCPNLEGLRRLEVPAVSKDGLKGEAGLALLDECEKRSISLLCRYGYL